MSKIRNNQSGFSAVESILVLVIVALIGVVGFMVYKDHGKSTASPVAATTKTTAPTIKKSVAAQPVDPTAGWATYTSTVGGFSFKYPTNGWTAAGARNPGYTTVTSAQFDGSEYEVSLKENTGQNLSTNGNQYNIVIDVGTSDLTTNYVNAKAQSSVYTKAFNEGTTTKLSNGLQLWQTASSADSSGQCSPNISYASAATVEVASGGNFYSVLPNGKYLQFEGDFCYGSKATTNLSYQQQSTSPETAVAKEVLASFKFQ